MASREKGIADNSGIFAGDKNFHALTMRLEEVEGELAGHGCPAFFAASNPALYAASSAARTPQTDTSWKSRESRRRDSSVSMDRYALAMVVKSCSVPAALL